MKLIALKAKWDTSCVACGEEIAEGEQLMWAPARKAGGQKKGRSVTLCPPCSQVQDGDEIKTVTKTRFPFEATINGRLAVVFEDAIEYPDEVPVLPR